MVNIALYTVPLASLRERYTSLDVSLHTRVDLREKRDELHYIRYQSLWNTDDTVQVCDDQVARIDRREVVLQAYRDIDLRCSTFCE